MLAPDLLVRIEFKIVQLNLLPSNGCKNPICFVILPKKGEDITSCLSKEYYCKINTDILCRMLSKNESEQEKKKKSKNNILQALLWTFKIK